MRKNEQTPSLFDRSIRVRRFLGMRGYGIYGRIVELIGAAPDRRLLYDVEDFAFEMREDVETIRRVAEEFGLFVFSDGFIEDCYNLSDETLEENKKKMISSARSEAGKKGAASRKAKASAKKREDTPLFVDEKIEENVEEKTAPVVEKPVERFVPTTENYEFDDAISTDDELDDSPEKKRYDELASYWNEIFQGTKRKWTHLIIPSDVAVELQRTLKIFSVDEIKEAFDQARKTTSYSWTFRYAVRGKNVETLLAQADLEKEKNDVENGRSESERRENQRLVDAFNASRPTGEIGFVDDGKTSLDELVRQQDEFERKQREKG